MQGSTTDNITKKRILEVSNTPAGYKRSRLGQDGTVCRIVRTPNGTRCIPHPQEQIFDIRQHPVNREGILCFRCKKVMPHADGDRTYSIVNDLVDDSKLAGVTVSTEHCSISCRDRTMGRLLSSSSRMRLKLYKYASKRIVAVVKPTQ